MITGSRLKAIIASLGIFALFGCSRSNSWPVRHMDFSYDSNGLAKSLWVQTDPLEKNWTVQVALTLHDGTWDDVSVEVPQGFKMLPSGSKLDDGEIPYNTRVYDYVTQERETVNSTFRFEWHQNILLVKVKPTISVS